MKYTIILAPEAVADLRKLKAHLRSEVRDAIIKLLTDEPAKTSRSPIKRLRGMSRPQYRLRVGDVRVFYDVTDDRVEILAVVAKSQAAEWLEKLGEAE